MSDEPEVFDPADHTVEEVKSYVEQHRDELADVLAAEQGGKERVTLLEWLEQQDEDDEEDTQPDLPDEAAYPPGGNVPFDQDNARRSP